MEANLRPLRRRALLRLLFVNYSIVDAMFYAWKTPNGAWVMTYYFGVKYAAQNRTELRMLLAAARRRRLDGFER